jgi:Na+/H+-dicarboxylate symporter
MGAQTVALYLFTMVLAVGVGLVLVNVFQPGAGSNLLETEFFKEALAGRGELPGYHSLPAFLLETLNQILANPFESLARGRILPIVVFAILLGIALLQIGASARGFIEMLGAGYQAIMKIIGWVIRLAPVGIFALIGKLVATVPFESLVRNLGEFALVVIGGICIHAFITLPLVAFILAGVKPAQLFRGLREALLVAFSTSSSAATLPVTTRCVEENLDVPPSVSSFVLPLGATVNMDGTALYEAIAAVFVATIYGVDLPLGTQLVIFFVAMVTAVGAPGIPSAGMVTMLVVLESVGLPSEAVGILITIDRFLDTFRTMANVEGDAVVSLCVAHSQQART